MTDDMPAVLDALQQQHFTDVFRAVLAEDEVRLEKELDALLVDNASREAAFVWALTSLDRATRDMFGDDAEPSREQVYDASVRAAAYFGALFPDVTPGVMADTAEFALARTNTLPSVISPRVCFSAAVELTAWIMTMHGDAAGDRVAQIVHAVAAVAADLATD